MSIDSNFSRSIKTCTSNHCFIINKNRKRIEIVEKIKIDKTVNKLIIQEIIIFSKNISTENLSLKQLNNIHAPLTKIANDVEEIHFQGIIGKVSKLFNTLYNGFSGRGFESTPSALRNTAQRLSYIQQYEKGKTATKAMKLSVKKDEKGQRAFLGGGVGGAVYQHADQPEWVVKKVEISNIPSEKEMILKEHRIGGSLSHPNLAATHRELYVKLYPQGNSKYKLVMDKIEGKRFKELYESRSDRVSDEATKKCFEQAKDCCLYLFDQNIGWADINAGNIFLTPQNNLKICDFGFWQEMEGKPQEKTGQLLLGSMEIVGWLVKSSFIRSGGQSNPDAERAILFPKTFLHFHQDGKFVAAIPDERTTQICSTANYQKEEWWKIIETHIRGLPEREMKQFLSDYFDKALQAFEEIRTSSTPKETANHLL